jgi:hypothetical protein
MSRESAHDLYEVLSSQSFHEQMMIESSGGSSCLSFQELVDLIEPSSAIVKSTESQTEELIDEQNNDQRKTSVSSVTPFHSKKSNFLKKKEV